MPGDKPTLIEALDTRQNDVIEQLDELNERIERTLKEWSRTDDAASMAASAEASDGAKNAIGRQFVI